MPTIPLRIRFLCEKKVFQSFGNHDEYLSRIQKSLYYAHLPKAYCTSLPCTELAAEIFSEINRFSIDQLYIEEAANLSHNACVSPCSLVLALLYLDRLKASNPKYLTKVSPSELFLISLMVGSKFLQDDGEEDEVNNYEWAASAGMDVQDINKAEKEFLDAINWEVFVSEKEFWNRFHMLECTLGLRQGCKRGWFTYTELHLLLELIDISTIIQAFCTVTTACLTSYTASMLTLLGSALLVGQIPGLGLKPKTNEMECNQQWNNALPYNVATNFFLHQNVQNSAVAPLSVGLKDLETANNFGYSRNPSNFTDFQISDCLNENRFHVLLKLSSTRSNKVSYPLAEDFSDRNVFEILYMRRNIWTWTDVVMHYLLMNSVPSTFFPVIDF